MEFKDLRCGNIVYSGSEWLVEHVVCPGDFEKTCGGNLLIETFNPIPLTEEWFIKLGFAIKDGKYWKMGGNRLVEIYLEEDGRDINTWAYMINKIQYQEVKYVHQLQNLFYALTSKELTLK